MNANERPDDSAVAGVSREFVSAAELAGIIGVSVKWITNNTHRIRGRVKIGKMVKYHLPEIRSLLLTGQSILRKDERASGGMRTHSKGRIFRSSVPGSRLTQKDEP